jgi:hypothetical protein
MSPSYKTKATQKHKFQKKKLKFQNSTTLSTHTTCSRKCRNGKQSKKTKKEIVRELKVGADVVVSELR